MWCWRWEGRLHFGASPGTEEGDPTARVPQCNRSCCETDDRVATSCNSRDDEDLNVSEWLARAITMRSSFVRLKDSYSSAVSPPKIVHHYKAYNEPKCNRATQRAWLWRAYAARVARCGLHVVAAGRCRCMARWRGCAGFAVDVTGGVRVRAMGYVACVLTFGLLLQRVEILPRILHRVFELRGRRQDTHTHRHKHDAYVQRATWQTTCNVQRATCRLQACNFAANKAHNSLIEL